MTAPERRAALVTGASRGIGALIAERLVSAGWDVTISARFADTLESVADDLRSLAPDARIHPMAADMADPDSVDTLLAAHTDRHGRLDALVLNAGMGSIGPLSEFPLRRVDKLYSVNVRAAFQLIQAALPLLRYSAHDSEFGARVIAVSSMTGIAGEPLNSAYGATKAALTSLCATLSVEESADGVSGTAVCPGYVATDMTAPLEGAVGDAPMIPAIDVARTVVALTALSKHVVVPYIPMARTGAHLWQA